jgi:NAD(P)-dependent dehydrogenase (short-subunit alcohol dehydrogenase family)
MKEKAMIQFDLAGRNALVIGGSSGIGNRIAHGLMEARASVAIAARNKEKLEAAAEGLRRKNPKARVYSADVARAGEIDRLAQEVQRDFGRIDILVNSQGITIIKPAEEFSEAEYDSIMATDLKSVFLASLAFGKPMLARGDGAIINIASIAGQRGWPRAVVYAMAKHGVVGLTQTLAAEWAARGVRVNAISPGYFMTDLNREKMGAERKAKAIARTPMGRFGELDELVGAAVYLASPAAKYVTGAVLNVDGGYLAAGI